MYDIVVGYVYSIIKKPNKNSDFVSKLSGSNFTYIAKDTQDVLKNYQCDIALVSFYIVRQGVHVTSFYKMEGSDKE